VFFLYFTFGTLGLAAPHTMVRHAFRVLTEDMVPTRLICFSDDMDGMRKIPDSVPDRAFLEPFLHKPLTAVPDPANGRLLDDPLQLPALFEPVRDALAASDAVVSTKGAVRWEQQTPTGPA
jgi:hypothetical protein